VTGRFADKSTVAEIRERFDADVERFSDLDTGQVAAKGSAEHMALVAEAAVATTPALRGERYAVCDIGCGAGNYTLRLLREIAAAGGEVSGASVTLIDLSRPMLERATRRLADAGVKADRITPIRGDVRDVDLGVARYDTILAAQCLHHLRGDAEWEAVFAAMGGAVAAGGSCWISDSIDHATAGVRSLMRRRWAAYLESIDGPAYRERVMAYVDREDTPRPLVEQVDLLRRAGFERVEVLAVDTRFGVFGGVRNGGEG
jgi:tRNA (cmo5U34)-methyltransferase